MRGFIGAVCATSILLAACSTPSPTYSAASWQDPLGTLTLPASTDASLSYNSGNDSFHRRLHQSMKGAVPVISVDMGSTVMTLDDINETPTRIVQNDPGLFRWVARTKLSGNQVMACQDREPEGAWALFSLLVNFASPWVNEYIIYRDAREYNFVAFYDSETEVISSVKFIRKSAIATDDLTCNAAHEV